RCEDMGISVAFVPQLAEKTTARLKVEHLGGLPIAFLQDATNPRGFGLQVKYAMDRVLAAILLCLTAPIFLAAGGGVRFSRGRPIFYQQRRVGRDGKEFGLLKFRSMTAAPEGEGEQQELSIGGDTAPGGIEGSDRRTRVGAFLRRTSLDEVPQLLNVL